MVGVGDAARGEGRGIAEGAQDLIFQGFGAQKVGQSRQSGGAVGGRIAGLRQFVGQPVVQRPTLVQFGGEGVAGAVQAR